MIWDESWEIDSGVELLVFFLTAVVFIINAALVVCWWFNCGYMAGKRFALKTGPELQEGAP